MGYYLRMEEILSLQLKSQEQIERWKEELQEVGKTLEVLGDTNELQGEAGTKLKDNIKNIHWKLTGKYETPMVKKMSKETEDLVMILFNNVDEQESYEAWDKLGQRLFSLSKSLIEKIYLIVFPGVAKENG